MAFFKKKEKKEVPSFEHSNEIKKLSLIITIVNKGQGKAVVHLLNRMECACSFIHKGEGTATKAIYDVLSLQDNEKDVIFSIIREDKVEETIREIESFFLANKKNEGISIRIDLDSIVGINGYRFLANQL